MKQQQQLTDRQIITRLRFEHKNLNFNSISECHPYQF